MNSRLVSQSFLGAESDGILAAIEVGIVGLGGGGSHVNREIGRAAWASSCQWMTTSSKKRT